MIRRGTLDDLEQLSTIERSLRPRRPGGFLVSGYGEADYRAFLDAGNVLLAPDAFVLYFDALDAPIYQGRPAIGVIKQIGVAPSAWGQGWGRRLYAAACADLATRRSGVMAAVVADNPASIAFHEALGFEVWDRRTPADGLPRLLFGKTFE